MDNQADDWEIRLFSSSNQYTECYDDDEETDVDEEDEEEEQEDQVYGVKNDDQRVDLACPFCQEDFDVLELCCHIDADHRMETKAGICPICLTKVRVNMAAHVITQHEKVLKALCKKKLRSARSRLAVSQLRKELQEKHLQSLHKESLKVDSASDGATDSLLLSFVHNPKPVCEPETMQATSTKACLPGESSNDYSLERMQACTSTDTNQEKARRCEFLQGLLLSTILDDL